MIFKNDVNAIISGLMRAHLPTSVRKITEQLLASADDLFHTGLRAKRFARFTSLEACGCLELDTMIIFISQRFKRLGNLLKVSLIIPMSRT